MGGKRPATRLPDRRPPALLLRRPGLCVPTQRPGPQRDPRRRAHTFRRAKRSVTRDRRCRDRELRTHRPAGTPGHAAGTPPVVGLSARVGGGGFCSCRLPWRGTVLRFAGGVSVPRTTAAVRGRGPLPSGQARRRGGPRLRRLPCWRPGPGNPRDRPSMDELDIGGRRLDPGASPPSLQRETSFTLIADRGGGCQETVVRIADSWPCRLVAKAGNRR